MVKDAKGNLSAGVGPTYVWQVVLNPVSTSNGATTISFSNTATNALTYYTVAYFPASDGCPAALITNCITSGVEPVQASLVRTN
jgi:hypothetical protein